MERTKKNPDFFLSGASELRGDLAAPRACWEKGRLSDEVRNDYMLIDVDPPLPPNSYGTSSEKGITQLIISTRHQGFTLFPITEWPSYVYIARPLDWAAINSGHFNKDQVQMIGWGMIFRTADEAKLTFKSFAG